MSSKATYILGYEDGREGRGRDIKSFWTDQEAASYAEGYGLGKKTGPYEPRHNAGHQRKAISAKRLQPGTPIEVKMFDRWVAGEVTHNGGASFLFTGAGYSTVTVDRPAYWRLPPGECRICKKGIERGAGGVVVPEDDPKALEHLVCGEKGWTATAPARSEGPLLALLEDGSSA